MTPTRFCPATVCRVGAPVTVCVEQAPDGEWSYPARILWVRGQHVGLTPPSGGFWQSLLQPGRPLWLAVPDQAVTARLRLRIVGLSTDLPPVLVLQQPERERPAAPADQVVTGS